MNTNTKSALYILLFALFFSIPSLAEVVDKSVAIVNDDIITLSEVNELAAPLYEQAAAKVPTDQLAEVRQQIKTSAINKLIDKKLMLQEAKTLQVSVSDQEVDRAIERIMQNNNMTRAQFQQELGRMNMTENVYREDLRDQVLSSKLVNYEVRSKVIIPEERVIDYYEKHFTEEVGKGGYYILQIGTTWDIKKNSGKEEALERLEEIHSLAKKGEDFKALAQQYSELPSAADRGDLGIFTREEMAPFMRDAVVDLKPGDISKIVEADDSYQFYTLVSSKGEDQVVTTMPYQTVKEDIREKLHKEEMDKRYKEWVSGIREKAYIKIF